MLYYIWLMDLCMDSVPIDEKTATLLYHALLNIGNGREKNLERETWLKRMDHTATTIREMISSKADRERICLLIGGQPGLVPHCSPYPRITLFSLPEKNRAFT